MNQTGPDRAVAARAWAKQDDESRARWHAFQHYRDLGPMRTLHSAWLQHLEQCLGELPEHQSRARRRLAARWGHWSSACSWVDRAQQYDQHLEREKLSAAEDEERTWAAKWARQRRDHRDETWAIARKLISKANQMLDFPLAEVEREIDRQELPDGRSIIINRQIVKPANWTFRDAARLADVADRLARLAAEMETSRQVVSVEHIDAEIEAISREFDLPRDDVIFQAEQILAEVQARDA